MTVEAVICVGGDDGIALRWSLREAKVLDTSIEKLRVIRIVLHLTNRKPDVISQDLRL
jgi:hypothetical protein